jgi:hypothetical protein
VAQLGGPARPGEIPPTVVLNANPCSCVPASTLALPPTSPLEGLSGSAKDMDFPTFRTGSRVRASKQS